MPLVCEVYTYLGKRDFLSNLKVWKCTHMDRGGSVTDFFGGSILPVGSHVRRRVK